MEDSLKNMLFAFILVSLFAVLILTAVVEVGNSYNIDTSEVTGGTNSLDSFTNAIKDVNKTAQDMKAQFDKQSIWSAVAGVVVEGIFSLTKTMFNLILAPFSAIANILENSFGVPIIVTSVVLGLVIMGAIFGIWRLLKVGD